MPTPNTILLLQGDAEARLLIEAESAVQALFTDGAVQLVRAWATRPDWLCEAAPTSLVESGILPRQIPSSQLLLQPHRLVIFSLLPAIAAPALRHRDGGRFVAHGALTAPWSRETAAIVSSRCVEEAPLSPLAAAMALEPTIERLQAQGSAVAVCVAFRRVKAPLEFHQVDGVLSLRQRIRQLNLEVARLSKRTGCFVLDLDRPLATAGGAALDADCFGGDGRAAEIALDEFAALLLDAFPDGFSSVEPS